MGEASWNAPAAGRLPWDRFDAALAVLLGAGTVIYLFLWPYSLYGFDEGLFLYEAKRIATGEVMYRDFFEIVTPASFYGFAALFALFGASMETARAGSALNHALIVVLVYLACRAVAPYRSLAAAAGAADVAVGFPFLPWASPHWCSTLVTMVITVALLSGDVIGRGRLLLLGALLGVLVLTQQQKGVVMAVGVGAILIANHAFARRAGRVPPMHLLTQLVWYASGLLAVVVPVLAAFVVVAGPEVVYRALVQYSIVNYRRIVQGEPWGFFPMPLTGLPSLVRFMPALIVVAAGRLVSLWWLRASPDRYWPVLVLAVLSAFGVLSVWYNPAFGHLVLVVPVWSVLAVETFAALLRQLAAWTPLLPRLAAGTLTLGFAAAVAYDLKENLQTNRANYPIAHQTAFGRVDFSRPQEVQLLEALDGMLSGHDRPALFAFPCYASLYLLTGTTNPTRFQILIPDYTDRGEIEEAVNALEAHKVPFVVQNFYWGTQRLEPLMSYLNQHYERVLKIGAPFPEFIVLRRKQQDGGPPPTSPRAADGT